jgi:uncharacterized protein YndB with AHSA1/START domain/DNA-binding transcriptional ArsR family regulator
MMSHIQQTDGILDSTFAALADATRRAILERLALGEATVSELAMPFKLSQPTISKHLKVLERAGLISCGRDAQRRPRRLVRKPLEDATAWLKGYRNPGTLLFSTPGDCEVVMKRSFAAGRDLVFDAFVRPELLRQWFFGKPGGTLAVCEVALKAGDPFRYVWRDADGSEMGMSGVCLEFVRPARIVATEEFDVRWYPGEAVGTISLEERDGLTALTQTIRYESRAARDLVLQTAMEHGIALGYDRLAKLLESIEGGRRKRNDQ